MKKLLVVLHLFYEDQLPYFLDKLGNIRNVDWDLLVTGSSISEDVAGRIREFKPDAKFLETGNAGYDIWPFIQAVRSVDLSSYEIVFKLHTKNAIEGRKASVAGLHMINYEWRDILVDSLLGSAKRFSEVVGKFDADPSCGAVCSAKLYTSMQAPEDCSALDKELERIGVFTSERRFSVGSMLAFRADTLRLLQTADLNEKMFLTGGKTRSGGTLAHVYERIISLLPVACGYKMELVDNDAETKRRMFFRTRIKPVIDAAFSIRRRGDHWEKYLTVLGITIKLDNGLDGAE